MVLANVPALLVWLQSVATGISSPAVSSSEQISSHHLPDSFTPATERARRRNGSGTSAPAQASRNTAKFRPNISVHPSTSAGSGSASQPGQPGTTLKDRGAPQIVLSTAEQNESAQRLFARAGFRRTMIEMTREVDADGFCVSIRA